MKDKQQNCTDECQKIGWLEAEGRLGLEIQMCQDCFVCKSDQEAHEKASKVIDTSKRIFIYKDNELTQKIGCGSELQACRLVDKFLATV